MLSPGIRLFVVGGLVCISVMLLIIHTLTLTKVQSVYEWNQLFQNQRDCALCFDLRCQVYYLLGHTRTLGCTGHKWHKA